MTEMMGPYLLEYLVRVHLLIESMQALGQRVELEDASVLIITTGLCDAGQIERPEGAVKWRCLRKAGIG